MCAFKRLSLVSGVWALPTSMLLIVAVMVIAVCAELNWNLAVPKDAGRAPPPDNVELVGGTSCPLVRLATNSLVSAGVRFAEASRLSTYCAFVSVDGYFVANSGRVTNSLKYATLFASNWASKLGVP